jgi:hypothetical protein
MKDFDHLMSVWQEQPKKDQLSVDEVLKQVKSGVNSLGRKLFWNIVSMAALLAGLFVMMLFFVFKSWVTYAGIVIILATMILYLLLMVRDYRIINNRDATINPARYLHDLKEYQKNRSNIYGWMFYLYVVLISSGLLLYFFEVLQSASTAFKIAAYSIYTALILFCTFYIRTNFVKGEQEKLGLMIDRLMRLQDQFD